MHTFADIILPMAIPQPYTYLVPEPLVGSLTEGMLVRVPLGKQKECEGVVCRIHREFTGDLRRIRPISGILSEGPIANERQLRFWQWMADYYLCTPGDVFKAAVPAGIRHHTWSPSRENHVRLTPSFRDGEVLTQWTERNRRCKAQVAGLLDYLSRIEPTTEPVRLAADPESLWISQKRLTETVPASIIAKLVERGVFERTMKRLEPEPLAPAPHPRASHPLAEKITGQFNELTATVLYRNSRTASELPELFLAMASHQVSLGKKTLILLPDTIRGREYVELFTERFTERCIVYNSKTPDRIRCSIYMRMIERPDSFDVVIGTRLTLFLPWNDLGLIMIDQEQDSGYRQDEPAPRYNGRDSALMLSRLHNGCTLLCGAAPSLETWANAVSGKYGYLGPEEPDTEPKITVLERGKGLISKYLFRRIEETALEGRQSVLFQNRRGFSPYLECGQCGYHPTCRHCSVTLTYHKDQSVLKCHYCGATQPLSAACPACGAKAWQSRGFGTQRVEEEAAGLFPNLTVSRLDADAPKQYNEQADVVAATQMIVRLSGKRNIGLIGVVNADNLLSHPDFRASEKAFQTFTQLCGLLPGLEEGELVLQSAQRDHPVLIATRRHDPELFYRTELRHREELGYPPFARLIRLQFRHPDPRLVQRAANAAGEALRPVFGNRVSMPFEPVVEKVQGIHILYIVLRIERGKSMEKAKKLLRGTVEKLKKEFPAVRMIPEADPL